MLDQYFQTPRQRRLAFLFLAALFGLLYIVLLGYRPLFIPDEMRYGEIPREMLASGDWIVPRLNGLLYFEKPPFGYWLNAVSLSIFGENPFAVRFSSALTTGLAALLVFVAGRHFYRSPAVPFLAVFIFLTTLEVQVIGTYSVLDPIFAVVLNTGILAMAAGNYASGRNRVWFLVAAGVALGTAFLSKGFLALVLPVLVVVPWLLVRKQFAFLFKDAWITVIVAAVTIAPWALAVHAKEADFWHYFFWVEHIQRFAADNAQHKAPIYYFLAYLPALAFPWVFLVPAIYRGLKSDRLPSSMPGATLLLVLWTVVPFTFFSISSGKLATYILPCFVPFSVLAATGLSSIRPPFRGMRLSLFIASGAAVLFLVALFVYSRSGDELVFSPGDTIKMVGLHASVAIMAGLLVFAALASRLNIKLFSVGASVIPFMLALPLCLPQATLDRKAPEAFIVDVVANVPSNTRIAANGSLVRATSWSAKRTDIYVIENGGETTYGLDAPDAAGRFLDAQALAELIGDQGGLLVFCKGACSSATKEVLPDNTQNFSSGNFFAHYVPPAGRANQADK